MENFLILAETETNAAIVVFNLLFSFALGITIAYVYRKTHHGLSYSTQFLTTLVLLAVLGSVVMMVVSQNLIGAFALLGAFSLIRFRTILKETRDIAFVFFALVVGVAIGIGSYVVAVLATGIISGIVFFLTKINFGSVVRGGHLLVVVADSTWDPESTAPWREYIRSLELLHTKTIGNDTAEYTLDVALRGTTHVSALTHALGVTQGVHQVELMNGRGSVEY